MSQTECITPKVASMCSGDSVPFLAHGWNVGSVEFEGNRRSRDFRFQNRRLMFRQSAQLVRKSSISATRRKVCRLMRRGLDVPLELMAAGLAEGRTEEGERGGVEPERRREEAPALRTSDCLSSCHAPSPGPPQQLQYL
ncbi:hypothetical protein Q8A73_012602 [Channa argus]|nr:hypothetical protein Q8A73_012602 [Channa argus]